MNYNEKLKDTKYFESKNKRDIMIIKKSQLDFEIGENHSEPIMVIRKNGEEINVKIGDTFKFGPGLFRIVGYKAKYKWPEINGVYPYESAVKCELIKGHLLYDFRRFLSYGPNGERYVIFSAKTIAHFVISIREKMEIIKRKRKELIRRLEQERLKNKSTSKIGNTDNNLNEI